MKKLSLLLIFLSFMLKIYPQQLNDYKKAAERGNASAQNNLGDCYFHGQGVSQDYEQAVYWYRKAADQNYANAQCSLGECYFYGYGVSQDYTQSAIWFRKAAEHDNINAYKEESVSQNVDFQSTNWAWGVKTVSGA